MSHCLLHRQDSIGNTVGYSQSGGKIIKSSESKALSRITLNTCMYMVYPDRKLASICKAPLGYVQVLYTSLIGYQTRLIPRAQKDRHFTSP